MCVCRSCGSCQEKHTNPFTPPKTADGEKKQKSCFTVSARGRFHAVRVFSEVLRTTEKKRGTNQVAQTGLQSGWTFFFSPFGRRLVCGGGGDVGGGGGGGRRKGVRWKWRDRKERREGGRCGRVEERGGGRDLRQ